MEVEPKTSIPVEGVSMQQVYSEIEPRFIYGTAWKQEKTSELTRLALECGFRAIDTANQRKHYHEAGVGEALQSALDDGLVERDELFLQTKFTHAAGQDHRIPYDESAAFGTQVEQSFESSLEHLGVDRIDSYVLHGPSTRRGLADADREVWRSMEALLEADRVGALGVSNVSAPQLQELLDWAEHPPACVQNRCFARTGWDREVRAICRENGLVYQGFSLLTANARELRSEAVTEIADRHDKTVPQIVFRFALHKEILPLTGTTSEEHMRQDLRCFEFELESSEIETIATLATS